MRLSFSICMFLGLWGCRTDSPVGFVAGLSGTTAEQGISERDGARLFVEGHGRKLLTCDSRSTPAGAARCIRELADSGAKIVIGPMYSNEADSALEVATGRGVLLVSPSVTAHRLSGKDDALLRVIGSNLDEADTLVSLLLRHGARTTVVVWGRLNAAYTEPIARRIAERFADHGLPAPLVQDYASSIDLQFDSLVAASPSSDAFVVLGTPMEAALLLRAVRRAGSKAMVLGRQSTMGTELLKVAGADAEGFTMTAFTEMVDANPIRAAFSKRFRERFGRNPSWASSFGWEAAAAAEPGWDAEDAQAAKRAILSRGEIAPLGIRFHLDKYGDAKRSIATHVVARGRIVLEPSR